MLLPKRTKHRKEFRRRNQGGGKAQTGHRVAFGEFGIKALSFGEISSRQIESARQTMSRSLARKGKIWIRVFPHTPITRKAAEVPMGSGKGSVDFYVARVKPGTVLFEIRGVSEEIAREAFRLAGHKLSVKTKLVFNTEL
ncbi:TPA: 50S ribosomal protein L16 [Candidatus Gracilibacteria bacterium]|nr:50S ribosomal protein L16 [Candidatus Gracilibacteria bacterium]